jgi:poly(3-hydroxybutyrate) depolymerase
MQSRRLRTVALAGLSALAACAQDPNTHASFTAVASTPSPDAATPPPDAAAPPPDAAAPPPDAATPPPDAVAHADGQTSGCGMDPGQTPNAMYVPYHLSVSGPDMDANMQLKVRDRSYFVRLPNTYDPTVPSRVVYLAPGCGGSTAAEVIRLYSASMDQAILVAMMPLLEFGGCFDETMTSVEYPFFDALHKKIESSFCVDPDRQFYAGFSTGARLGFMLDCAFPDVLRATATIQGALPPLPTCRKHPIAAFFVADTQEMGNPYQSNVMAAQQVFKQNGCTGTFMSPMPPTGCGTACANYDTGATPLPPMTTCVRYTGCPAAYPVVFCSSVGLGHITYEKYTTTSTAPWSDQAFWNFFKAF